MTALVINVMISAGVIRDSAVTHMSGSTSRVLITGMMDLCGGMVRDAAAVTSDA